MNVADGAAEEFAKKAALIEPFPVPELDVVYASAEEFAADLRDVICLGVRLAANGTSTDDMKRFARWFGELLKDVDLNPQQRGAARWLTDRLCGASGAGAGWQEKLTSQLAQRAAQVRCGASADRTGPKTSPQFMRMIAADVELRGEGSISAVARDHGISRQAVRDALDRVHARRDKLLAKKIREERERRKIEQRKQRLAVKVAERKALTNNAK